MTDVRIAALCYQYSRSGQGNRETIRRLLSEAGSVDIAPLPEDSAGPDALQGESIPGPFTEWLQETAARLGVALIGNLIEKADEGRFDTCCIIDRSGDICGIYRKIQLSHSDRHARRLRPGDSLAVFSWRGLPIGVAVCYDTWYPEIIRLQALRGARIMFAPFKEEPRFLSRVRSLVSARAIENLVWMVCCGAGWKGPGPTLRSFAWVVAPSGEFVKDAGQEEFLVYHIRNLEKTREEERSLKNWNRPYDARFGGLSLKDASIPTGNFAVKDRSS
jgi:predicted amidohydrolase